MKKIRGERRLETKAVKATVILITYNYWKETYELLHCLKKYTPDDLYKLVIVDNNSSDGTFDNLSQCTDLFPKKYELYKNAKNVMLSPALNFAFTKSEGNLWIYLCARGCVIRGHRWLEDAIDAFEKHPSWGMAGDVWPPGRLGWETTSKYYKHPILKGSKTLHVQGGMAFHRRDMVEKIGMYSEKYPFGATDIEYSNRAMTWGWDLGQLPYVKSTSGQGASFLHGAGKEITMLHHVIDGPFRKQILAPLKIKPFKKKKNK